MNVKNSSCIRKLAVRTLKKSSKRNIIAVAAIALTTLLITSIFSVAFSFKTASDTFNGRIAGCNADVYFDDLSDSQRDEVLSLRGIKETGEQIRVGMNGDQQFNNRPLEIAYLDDQSMEWCYATPLEGRAPEEYDEVVVDKGLLRMMDLPEETGTTINIPYYSYVDKTPVVGTFEVVGLYEENTIGPCHYVCVSEEYAKSVNGVSRLNLELKGDAMGFMENVLNSTDIDQCGQYQASDMSGTDFESVAIIGVFLLVIGFSGYLIIYNIFQISVVNDISYYGLLKTIGVTGRQLKKIIRIQSLILSAVGIPLGLVLGYFVGRMTSPAIFASTIFAPVANSFSVSPWIFVISCVFALVTVFISCSRPGRIASRISPVEAFRYSEVKTDNKNNKRVSGLSGMAMRNLARNKKKTILVFLSMALPVVILSLGISLANSMSFEDYYSSDYAFKVSNNSYFNYEIPTSVSGHVKDFISDADIENINDELDFKTFGSAYTTAGIPEADGGLFSVVTGIDDVLFDKVDVIEGDIDPLFDPDSDSVAFIADSFVDREVHVGDKVTVDYGYTRFKDSRTGEIIEDEGSLSAVPFKYLDTEKVDNTKEYVICAIVQPSSDLYIGYTFYDSYELLLPASRLEADADGNIYRYLTVFDSPASGDMEESDDAIKEYCEEHGLMYRSAVTERIEFNNYEGAIRKITITLCVVLLVIGILNFINAVLTGILTRSHEFAVLKAIGMTDRQQERVLIAEGIIYVMGSILLGTAVYTILHFPFTAFFADMDYIDPHFSLVPITAIALVFAVFGILIPYLVYSVVKRKTVVERLRINE